LAGAIRYGSDGEHGGTIADRKDITHTAEGHFPVAHGASH